jgi:hypothetical protein
MSTRAKYTQDWDTRSALWAWEDAHIDMYLEEYVIECAWQGVPRGNCLAVDLYISEVQ